MEFRIGNRPVGPGHPTYVIAEAGANHNRDLGTARELIDVAADAGADAVKFQTYSGASIYSTKTPRFDYLAPVTDKPPSELLEDISLPREWQPGLAAYARERGIDFFSTPFDFDAVRELDALDVPVLKVASFELVDLTLIRRVAETGRPLILSTGMAVMGEIEDALRAAREAGASAIGLMQCTSVYPAPAERINLRAMATMERAFGVPVGLSDHSLGTAVPIAAAALGAAFVEKHYTLSRAMEGPDHPFALEPDELRAMVAGIREAQAALGNGRKEGPSPEEAGEMYVLGRRSLIAVRELPAGTVLERDMITVKRPGFGIPPKHLDLVVGRPLKVAVEADEILTWDMV
ncbi:MAG TPA: N-acetylneuraminate synthase family protein [Solirubrobacteraceae bacterium]|nr:N-acetylneuraminate synthase family protein [Solirubrobacteraceae bacterium]